MSNSTVIFYLEDGTIIGQTVCVTELAELQSNPIAFGKLVLDEEFRGDPTKYFVEDDQLVLKTLTAVEADRMADKVSELRPTRDRLLSQWVDGVTALRLEAMTEEKREEWRAYRQALLDFPETCTDPANPVWPTPPA